ncbi:MAG: gluconate 2-dehydrogenase subunit 3 family protein [Terriglobia bacterium]
MAADKKVGSTTGIDRREMVRRLATAMTAGMAIPGIAEAHPVHHHLRNEATMQAASESAGAENWAPLFFDPHQNETFTVLAERIIPGSTGAQVNRFVDLLLSVDTMESQKRFLNSLSAFEAYSIQHYGHPFSSLTQDQQTEVLTLASTTKPAGEMRHHRRVGLSTPARSKGEEAPLTLRDHFENLKQWVSGAYFSSEDGMKYLGWTGQVIWPSFPGCQHPGGHQ